MKRRNSDEKMRALEREALRSGDQAAVERLSVARVRAGLSEIPGGLSARCLSVFLGVGPSALVRVGWDELVPSLGLQDHLIWFDGGSWHWPDWIDRQVDQDSEWWINEWSGPRLTDDQRGAVRKQFLYALEPEWMPPRRITKDLIERWIVEPINADSGGFWNVRTARAGEFCHGTAISVESIDQDSGQDSGATFRVFEPFFVALFAHSRDDGRDLLVEKIASEDVLEAAGRSRDSGEVRVRLPEHSGDDYDAPSSETLEKAIRDAAPKKPKRKAKSVKKRRNSTQEERSVRLLKDELDDAIFFKYPESRIAALREQIARLEAEQLGATRSTEGTREDRLEQDAFRLQSAIERLLAQAAQLARQIESSEYYLRQSISMRDPASEIKQLRDEIASRRAEHAAISLEIDAQARVLSEMAAAAQAELAAAAPVAPSAPRTELVSGAERARRRDAEHAQKRRTYDGRLLDDDSAMEIDRLTGMVERGSFTKSTLQELMQDARRRYERLQRSESLLSSPLLLGGERMEPVSGEQDAASLLREIGLKLMIFDHVLNTAFKVERAAPPPPPRPTPQVRSRFMEDDR